MQPCLFALMKKKLIVLKPTGTLASLQCRYIIFEMTFDWYSQNVWNNTYGPTIHLFPIRLLRKNFWCYKMKKEGNLIIMLTDFSAMMCYVLRGDIFTSTLDVSSLNFCDMVVFFSIMYDIYAIEWHLFHHLQILKVFIMIPPTCNPKKTQRRRGNSINEDHFKCQTLPLLQFMRARFHAWYAAY